MGLRISQPRQPWCLGPSTAGCEVWLLHFSDVSVVRIVTLQGRQSDSTVWIMQYKDGNLHEVVVTDLWRPRYQYIADLFRRSGVVLIDETR